VCHWHLTWWPQCLRISQSETIKSLLCYIWSCLGSLSGRASASGSKGSRFETSSTKGCRFETLSRRLGASLEAAVWISPVWD
jgi:hypothetical protein